MIYPTNYHNFILKRPLEFLYPADMSYSRHGTDVYWEMHSGYFKDEEVLVDYMNKELMKLFKKKFIGDIDPFFRYDKATKKMRFFFKANVGIKGMLDANGTRSLPTALEEYDESIYEVGMTDDFKHRFGLEAQYHPTSAEAIPGSDTFELPHVMLYVYSDIVSPYLVGDVQTPLLRVINPKGKRDEIVSVSFNNPFYVPVARRGFDTIEININDQFGQPIAFTGGRSLVVLHFRRCDESLLSNTSK
jgi:hypothetical protein